MKNNITPLLYKFIFAACLFACIHVDVNAQSNNRIRIIFGTRSHPNAQGQGCEGDKGICIILTTRSSSERIDMGEGELSIIGDEIQLNILRDPSPATREESIFYVYEDKILPAEIAEQLGYKEIVIARGKYPIDKSRNKLGTVNLDARFQ